MKGNHFITLQKFHTICFLKVKVLLGRKAYIITLAVNLNLLILIMQNGLHMVYQELNRKYHLAQDTSSFGLTIYIGLQCIKHVDETNRNLGKSLICFSKYAGISKQANPIFLKWQFFYYLTEQGHYIYPLYWGYLCCNFHLALILIIIDTVLQLMKLTIILSFNKNITSINFPR